MNKLELYPDVSVIIPTYNYAQYICEAVNSILKQSYPINKIEIIVIDDGSTDNTVAVLAPFIEKKQIVYQYQQNKGKAVATAAGIQQCKGKYIFNLDADDYFLLDKISISVAKFESDDSIVHVASAAQCIFQDTKKTGNERLPENLIETVLDGDWLLDYFYDNNILYGGGSTYAARASTLKSIDIPAGVDMYIDEFLILAILQLGKSFFVEQPLSVWRIHTANYSGKTLSKEKQIAKNDRLIHSSAAILDYIESKKFKTNIIKTYQLQHATRQIVFKEAFDNKSFADIFEYANNVFFVIKPGWPLIKKHHVLNRFIPTILFKILKKLKSLIHLIINKNLLLQFVC